MGGTENGEIDLRLPFLPVDREISIFRRYCVVFCTPSTPSYLRPSPRSSVPVLTQQRPQHLLHLTPGDACCCSC